MSNFHCRCGTSTSLEKSPGDCEFSLVPEINIDLITLIFGKGIPTEEEVLDTIDKGARSVIVCPNCNRVWIEDESDPAVLHCYVPEFLAK